MDKLKKAVASTKKFVSDHRVAIAVTATAATCLWINGLALKQHNEFLKEHDLYDTYYLPED